MNEIKEAMPQIIGVCLILNIIGNMIKITFKIPGKYIIWILLPISIAIYFTFFGVCFDGFLMAFLSFSFSVSSYDLVKYSRRIIRK